LEYCIICKIPFIANEKVIELRNARKVCGCCAEYSGAVLECDGCGEDFLAVDLVRDEGITLCCACIREAIEEKFDFFTWSGWEEASDEDDPATVEGFIAWHIEAWEGWPEDHPYRLQLAKMVEAEIEPEARAVHRSLLDSLAGSATIAEVA
jgi:hypothetical protein